MANAEVIKVFDGASDDLLALYENFCDLLRYPAAVSDGDITSCFASSPSTNVHARQAHERFKYSITGARYGGRTEAVRRVLAQLPISAQSYSTSPFLDLSLFSYDDKWVSAMERPKACGDHPIRFVLLYFLYNTSKFLSQYSILFVLKFDTQLFYLKTPKITNTMWCV